MTLMFRHALVATFLLMGEARFDATLPRISAVYQPGGDPGKLGTVEQGALADLLLVDGNPLENINLVADPGKNFLVIMKDGAIYKNTLPK